MSGPSGPKLACSSAVIFSQINRRSVVRKRCPLRCETSSPVTRGVKIIMASIENLMTRVKVRLGGFIWSLQALGVIEKISMTRSVESFRSSSFAGMEESKDGGLAEEKVVSLDIRSLDILIAPLSIRLPIVEELTRSPSTGLLNAFERGAISGLCTRNGATLSAASLASIVPVSRSRSGVTVGASAL